MEPSADDALREKRALRSQMAPRTLAGMRVRGRSTDRVLATFMFTDIVGSGLPVAVGVEDFANMVGEDLAAIGIDLNLEEPIPAFEAFEDPSVKVALFLPHGWGRDYLSASNFFVGQFYSPVALTSGGFGNASLVGASAEQLAGWGYGDVEVPNVDSRIEACIPLTGAAQFECWAALDQYMMENVVSSVPCNSGVITILASSRVIGYSWDELAIAPAYDRIELTP